MRGSHICEFGSRDELTTGPQPVWMALALRLASSSVTWPNSFLHAVGIEKGLPYTFWHTAVQNSLRKRQHLWQISSPVQPMIHCCINRAVHFRPFCRHDLLCVCVSSPFVVSELPPQILTEDGNTYTVTEGQKVLLECDSFGSPKPKVSWWDNRVDFYFLSHTCSFDMVIW